MLRALTGIAAGAGLLIALAGSLSAQTAAEVPPLTQPWGTTLNGPANLDDLGADVDLGPDGSIYAVGSMNAGGVKGWLGKFSAAGDVVWSYYFPGKASGVAAAPDGSIYVTGTASCRMYVKKFLASGCVVWTKTFEGKGLGVAASPTSRAVYVTGSLAGDVVVRKLDPFGQLIWTRTYNGRAKAADEGKRLVVDHSENLYVVGFVRAPGEGRNIFLRKYSAGGRARWTREVTGEGGGHDWASGVALDAAGNVYLTGAAAYAGKSHLFARAYTPQGQLLWNSWWDLSQYVGVRGNDVAIAPTGTVNIIGTGTTPTGSSRTILMRLLPANGELVDQYDLLTDPLGIGAGNGIVATGDGFVYAGSVLEPPGQGENDIIVVKLR